MVSPLVIVFVRAELNDNDVTGLPEVSAEDDSGAGTSADAAFSGGRRRDARRCWARPVARAPPVGAAGDGHAVARSDVGCRHVHRRGLRHGLAGEEQVVGRVVERRVCPAAVVT